MGCRLIYLDDLVQRLHEACCPIAVIPGLIRDTCRTKNRRIYPAWIADRVRTDIKLFQRALRSASLPPGLPAPLSRGGRPVCWVRMRPLTGANGFNATAVEFLRRALV